MQKAESSLMEATQGTTMKEGFPKEEEITVSIPVQMIDPPVDETAFFFPVKFWNPLKFFLSPNYPTNNGHGQKWQRPPQHLTD